MGRTLYDKIWDEHVVHVEDDGTAVLYIDRHLVHEVTSPQAFEGLDLSGRKVWRISANLAVSDHNVPTTDRSHGIADPVSRLQVDTLDANCDRYGITQFKMNDKRQGIVHVIGPEQGATLPGMTVVCGDSHTSTHGAFGALEQAIAYWRTLHSDADAHWDALVELDASTVRPQVTWGTSPEMVVSIEDRVPDPEREKDPNKRNAIERALTYMALEPNKPIA